MTLASLLKCNLGPFRAISGLSKLTTTIRLPRHQFWALDHSHVFENYELLRKYHFVARKRARAYLDAFEFEMLQPIIRSQFR